MIIKNQPTKDFTVLRNNALVRKDLSLKAKGLYAFLMSKPDGWETNIRGLETLLLESRNTIMRTLQELEAAGYYRKTKTRNADGTFKWEDFVYDEPCRKNDDMEQKPLTMSQLSMSQKTMSGERRHIVNTEEVKTEQVKDATNVASVSAGSEVRTFDDGTLDPRNPEVQQMIEHFEKKIGKMPQPVYQRRAALTLIQRHGFEKTIGAINAVAISRGEQFAPNITALTELRDKWLDLENFYLRAKNKKGGMAYA